MKGMPVAIQKIPERFKPGIALLGNMSDESYSEILEAAKRAPSTFLNNREVIAWIGDEVKTISKSELSTVIESLTSLYRLRLRLENTAEQISRDVADNVKQNASEFNVRAEVDLQARLAPLLAMSFLGVIAIKAKELQIQSEKVLCEASVLTDIRPVFGEKVDDPPSAMFVTHTLKLTIHQASSSDHAELYISLDSDDLVKLKKTLERAEQKERSLKSVFEVKGLKVIDLE
jgi:hypothetical protein